MKTEEDEDSLIVIKVELFRPGVIACHGAVINDQKTKQEKMQRIAGAAVALDVIGRCEVFVKTATCDYYFTSGLPSFCAYCSRSAAWSRSSIAPGEREGACVPRQALAPMEQGRAQQAVPLHD